MIGNEKERAESSTQQILTGSGSMKEVEVQDSEPHPPETNLCTCFHMLWFSSVSTRKQAKKFLEDLRAPHLTSNSL